MRLLAAVTLLLGVMGGGAALAQEDTTTTLPAAEATTPASVPGVGPNAKLTIYNTELSRFGTDGQVTMYVALQGLTADVDPSQVVITEDGQVIEDAQVVEGDFSTVPSFVALVIDTSGSMDEDGRLDSAKAAAISFVEQKEPEDFVALVTFSDEATIVSNFVSNADTLIEAIDALVPQGATAMFDGVVLATDVFRDAGIGDQGRRSMIVLTDGEDQGSVNGVNEAISAVQREDVRTFGVAIESGEFEPVDLEAIATEGGGFFLPTADPEELSSIYGQIQRELNRAIVIRFRSTVQDPTAVEFGVRYGSLQASTQQNVPGFATTTTTVAPTTTIYQLASVEPQIVTYDLPLELDAILLLATLGIGGAVALMVFILIGSGNDSASRFGKRLAAYGRRGGLAEEKRSFLERVPLLNRFTAAAEEQVRKRGLLGAVNATLEQANLPLSAGEAIAAGIGLSAVGGLIAGVLTASPLTALMVFTVATLLVFGTINYLGSREKKRFENQLPDTLTLLSTSLRAGYSLLQAIEAVAQEAPDPTAREFGRAIAEARLGRQVTDALGGITTRTQSKDFEWAVMAIDIQREVGGNLAEVLQTVADTMMARNRLRGEIMALTAEGRISAIVLGGLPFAIGGFLFASNPDYLRPLFESPSGLIAIGVGLTLMAMGMLWLRKIVNIEV
ncbi:MAG: type II secretion system F family protein [Acidimicrobiia bacterium]